MLNRSRTLCFLPLLLAACSPRPALAQAPLTSWSGAEFVQRGDNCMIALTNLQSYTPKGLVHSLLPGLSFDADLFAGYDTTKSVAITGVAGLADYSLGSKFSLGLGLGDKLDLSKQFSLNELTIRNAGFVASVTYKF